MEADLWRLLLFGTYQLAFAQTPQHAAVDTTVDLAKQMGKPRWTGFVNGVLRNIARLLADEYVTSPAQNAIPVAGGQYRALNSEILPHPELQRAEYISQAFSLPMVLVKRWMDRFPCEQMLNIGFHCLTPPRLTLRGNSLKTSASELHKLFRDKDVEFVAGDRPESLTLTQTTRVIGLPGYESGLWSVQDSSAMHAAVMLAPQADEHILDLCAAPGGKTSHLAELSQCQAEITACDVSQAKLDRIRQNVDRLGLSNIQLKQIHKDSSNVPDGPFDAVLVDVPCSNTGVLSRRPEARWRFREADLPELTQLQSRLLMTAFDRLKPGGRLVYSTCSIELKDKLIARSDRRFWNASLSSSPAPSSMVDAIRWARPAFSFGTATEPPFQITSMLMIGMDFSSTSQAFTPPGLVTCWISTASADRRTLIMMTLVRRNAATALELEKIIRAILFFLRQQFTNNRTLFYEDLSRCLDHILLCYF